MIARELGELNNKAA
ncbi:TPA: hypothetical protein ACYZ28_004268 [Escherichia coli]